MTSREIEAEGKEGERRGGKGTEEEERGAGKQRSRGFFGVTS
jgi:hypothetical protein